MKVKYFEELINECDLVALLSGRKLITDKDVLMVLMGKVRKETIKECTEILLNPDFKYSGEIENEYKKMDLFSIKTT